MHNRFQGTQAEEAMWKNEHPSGTTPVEVAHRLYDAADLTEADMKVARETVISDLIYGGKVSDTTSRDIFEHFLNKPDSDPSFQKCLDILNYAATDPYNSSCWAHELIAKYVDENEHLVEDMAAELRK